MIRPSALAAAILLATPALAHTGLGDPAEFARGLAHPLQGIDHVLAMGAVGLWAGLVGGRAVLAWPAAFVAMMAVGAMMGLSDATLPGTEAIIAGSVIVLGLAVAARAPLSAIAGAAVCGAFALFHGFAHGAELPDGANVAGFMAGFTAATALLHAAGVALGLALARVDRVWLPGLAGSALAATGLVLLAG